MPLLYPWKTAYGEDSEIYSVFVNMFSQGEYSWSEISPLKFPTYSPESTSGAYALMKNLLAPKLINQKIEDAEDINNIFNYVKGNFFAKAGLEIAYWLLKAKVTAKPLHDLIGGVKKPVSVGADFGIQDNIKQLITKIDLAVKSGYPRVKLKFRRGWDIDMLKAVRDVFPEFVFHIDCNSSFTLDDLEFLKKLDRFNLAMIEQPLQYNDLLDHAKLQRELSTPVCLDESITSPKIMEEAIYLESCKFVNIKFGRVGGITNVLKIHNLAKDAKIPCWIGSMLESSVGMGISAELATLPNCTYPADVFPSKSYYNEDLSSPEIELCKPGYVDISHVAGIPYEPKPDMLKRNTLNKVVIKS